MDKVGDRMQALAVLLGFATEEQPVYVSFETVFDEYANKVSAAGLQAVRETIGERIGQVETQGKGKAKRGRKPMTPEYRKQCREHAAEYRVFLDKYIRKERTKHGARKAFATSKGLKRRDSDTMIRSGTPAKPHPRKRGQKHRG